MLSIATCLQHSSTKLYPGTITKTDTVYLPLPCLILCGTHTPAFVGRIGLESTPASRPFANSGKGVIRFRGQQFQEMQIRRVRTWAHPLISKRKDWGGDINGYGTSSDVKTTAAHDLCHCVNASFRCSPLASAYNKSKLPYRLISLNAVTKNKYTQNAVLRFFLITKRPRERR
jgi:hypothetical protein